MAYIDFVSSLHRQTKRDYLARVNEYPKAVAAKKCKDWGYDYWDGDRKICYGGYHYDGRWKSVAEQLIAHYQLKAGNKVLDIGCGKGFLAYELQSSCPGLEVYGLDISNYALQQAKPEVASHLVNASAQRLPFKDNTFDLIISLNTLHNLPCHMFYDAMLELNRVSKGKSYLVVETYRDEDEKVNLLYWQVTCEMFCTPEEWAWWFKKTNYTGDYSFVWFE